MVDPRQRPLAGLDDHVDRPALELAQAMAEPEPLQLLPRDTGLVVHLLVADAPVAGDQPKAESRQVAGLDLADVAGDQVVVEQVQELPDCAGTPSSARNLAAAATCAPQAFITSISSSRRSSAACPFTATCSARWAGTASVRRRENAARRSGTSGGPAPRSASARRRPRRTGRTIATGSASTMSRSRRPRARP